MTHWSKQLPISLVKLSTISFSYLILGMISSRAARGGALKTLRIGASLGSSLSINNFLNFPKKSWSKTDSFSQGLPMGIHLQRLLLPPRLDGLRRKLRWGHACPIRQGPALRRLRQLQQEQVWWLRGQGGERLGLTRRHGQRMEVEVLNICLAPPVGKFFI